jgi:hypothetical protein
LDLFLAKIEEWIDRSKGKIRADVCYEKLVALGCGGSDREREQQHSQGQQWRHQEFELGALYFGLGEGSDEAVGYQLHGQHYRHDQTRDQDQPDRTSVRRR